MDAYRHITPIERGRIMTLFEQGHSSAAIATMLKRHRCTILRELKRNSDGEATTPARRRRNTTAGVSAAAASVNLMTRNFLPWSRRGF